MKKIVNRSVFDEVMPKILLVRFFPDTVYNRRSRREQGGTYPLKFEKSIFRAIIV